MPARHTSSMNTCAASLITARVRSGYMAANSRAMEAPSLWPNRIGGSAMAQAAKNLEKAGKVIITGFATPSSMRGFVKDDTVKAFGLWDCKLQGAIGAYIAYWLADGNTFKVGDFIGLVGDTGTSYGSHLHFELHVDKVPVDPFAWLTANAVN